MRPAVPLALVALLLPRPGPDAAGADPAKDGPREAIEQANAAFGAAFAKGDPKAVAGLYTESARLLPPNAPTVEGRTAIEAFWKAVMAAGVKAVELKTVEVESFGDALVEQGTATLFGPDRAVIDRVKYLVLWKRVDGQWRLHRDCWNSSESAPKK